MSAKHMIPPKFIEKTAMDSVRSFYKLKLDSQYMSLENIHCVDILVENIFGKDYRKVLSNEWIFSGSETDREVLAYLLKMYDLPCTSTKLLDPDKEMSKKLQNGEDL